MGGSLHLQQPPFGQGHPRLGAVADDDVIVKSNINQSRGVSQLPRQPDVLCTRRRVPARVVVNADDRGRAPAQRRSQHLARMHEAGALGADRHLGVE